MKPLCFVIMPFGKKIDTDGKRIDFDAVYNKLIQPAIAGAGMEAIRADEEIVNGIIHKPMYERLILCDYAIADLTTANANVFYELGIRHAVKPFTTIAIFGKGSKLPFDVAQLRCQPYDVTSRKSLSKIAENVAALTKQLKTAKRKKDTDSPVYQLVDGIAFQNSVAHQKTDVFRDQVEYNARIKNQLQKIRNKDSSSTEDKLKALDAILDKQINPEDEEAGVLIDVMLSYRSLEAYDRMVTLIESFPAHIKNTVMAQEQLGFALNRLKKRDDAIKVLETVVQQNGPSSETYGILGRVYKDKFETALKDNNEELAESMLLKAIDTYTKGFEADWRDAYPGINALTLQSINGNKPVTEVLAPVVDYAVQRKIQSKGADYWDYATLLEIGVITNDEKKAKENLSKALSCTIENEWMFKTTLKNLELISMNWKEKRDNMDLALKMSTALTKQLKLTFNASNT